MSDKSPDAFRTISEVADWLGVQPHVLRFWESKFTQVRPVKRAGGRRYYRPNDMLLLGGIRKLLHEDGLTIKGAQKVLREEGISHVARMSQPLDAESAALSDMGAMADDDPDARPADSHGDALTTGPDPSQPEALPEQPAHHPARPEPEPQVPPRPELSGRPAPSPEAEDADTPPEPEPERPSPPQELPSGPDPEDEPEPERAPLPSFMHRPRPAAEPKPAPPEPKDRLPSFLRPPQPADPQKAAPHAAAKPPDPEAEAELPLEMPAAPERAEPEADDPPKPRIVDAPDPDESAFEVTHGALSAAFSGPSISARRRADLLPLVARMAALRDRIAAEPGR